IPPEWGDWAVWQYSDSGTVAGIGGMVDVNKFNGSRADLQALCGAPSSDDGGAPDGGNPLDAGGSDGAAAGADRAGGTDGAARGDGGTASTPPHSCSCALGGRPVSDGAAPLLALPLAALALRASRRRRAAR